MEDEEEEQTNELYSWTCESNDLGQLVIGLRKADDVTYSYKIIDEYTVEISAKGEMTNDEIIELSKFLGVPKNMVEFRFQPWKKNVY